MTTVGTQDEEKTKEKHNAICIGHQYAQAITNNVIYEPSYKQLEVKADRT